MIYKLKLWTSEEIWLDFYLDVTTIKGFYIPEDKEVEPSINIFIDGGCITVQQEQHITNYLYKTFVYKAKDK